MRRATAIVLVVALLVLARGHAVVAEPVAPAPEVGAAVSIRTAGGGRFQGTVHGVLDDRIEVLLSDGQIVDVARSQIQDVVQLDESAGERGFFEDSAANRLVVMPTGFPLERGEFHVASQEIIAVTGSYGINDWLSVWGGVSIPGALFSLRASAHLGESVGASFGTFVGASWLDLSLGPLVLPYALVSYGTDANNATLGAGLAMTFSEGFTLPGGVVAVGGKRTLTSTTALVTENWVLWAERSDPYGGERTLNGVPVAVAPSLVFRIASSRLSWDLGAVVPVIIQQEMSGRYYAQSPVIPIPIFSVTYRVR